MKSQKWTKKKKMVFVGDILVIIVFAFLICTANDIVANCFLAGDDAEVKRIGLDLSEFESGNTNAWIEESPVVDSILRERVRMTGWAYCCTEQENGDRNVSVILRSDSNAYMVDATVKDRTLSAPMAKGAKLSFQVTFSTVSVKNGLYDIYLYVKENQSDFGLVKSNLQLEKINGTANIQPFQSTENEKPKEENIVAREDMVVGIQMEEANNCFKISGIAYLPHENTYFQNYYIEIEDEVGVKLYEPIRVPRWDITVKNQEIYLYDRCGFQLNLNQENCLEGDWHINAFYIENQGIFYRKNL